MKFLLPILVFILLNACGGSNNDVVDTDETQSDLFYQQWSINHNTELYSKENINENAHINPQNVLNEYTGKGIKVAIIDDGFDVEHPEIKENIIFSTFVNYDGTELDSNVAQSNSNEFHGTAVTGIIAAKDDSIGIRGIAPDVELILIKYPPSSTDSGTIALFDQALQAGADIINCSWGSPIEVGVSDTIRAYIKDIVNKTGVIIVFASGNNKTDMVNDESSMPEVIGVGATSEDNLRTTYSNYGKELDIVAPGGQELGITTLDPIGEKGLSSDEYLTYNLTHYDKESDKNVSNNFTGTSASAPIVTATIALALEKNPNLTRIQIQEILKYSTDTIGNNTPYLDDMVSSNELQPTITGLLGTSRNDSFNIKLIKNDDSNITTNTYPVIINDNDNTFSSKIQEDLLEGEYTVQIVSNDNNTSIWAVDENLTINYSVSTITNTNTRKSNYYGYGKLNLEKFINNIPLN